jgi:soluble lytic murein transglycosylase
MRNFFTAAILLSLALNLGWVATADAEIRLGKGQPLPTTAAPLLPEEEPDEAAAPTDIGPARTPRGPDVLSGREIKATKRAFQQARTGQAPNLGGVPGLLQGYVQAAYLLADGHRASAAALNTWLARYGALAPAGEIYALAEARRAKPREVCTTKTERVKVAKKGKHKPKFKNKKVRSCRMVGEWGPAPPKTGAMLAREARQEAAQSAADARRQEMAPVGRQLVTQAWRQRSGGNWAGALNTLLTPGARSAMGGAAWQEELVKVADFYHGKRDWELTYRAAAQAAQAQGPRRDEALWLAGYAAYRQGDTAHAAEFWRTLVRDEPQNGKHYGRAAWWAARVLEDLGESRQARTLLQAGAQNPLSFYGQLAAMKLRDEARLNFAAPGVPSGALQMLLASPQAQAGLALAQVGETDWAEAELRAATPNLAPAASRALAGLAVALDLPSAALRTGRELWEAGVIEPAALFPLPPWQPSGGWRFDRAFMLGLMRQESAFQPKIGSRVGAQGLMQIMPSTGQYIARLTGRDYAGRHDLHHPATNLAMAQDYLNYLSNKLDGNLLLVAAAYNGGIGNVQRWLARGVTPDRDPLLWLESIPFDETRDYVEKVMLNYWVYQQRLGVPRNSLRALAENRWPNTPQPLREAAVRESNAWLNR